MGTRLAAAIGIVLLLGWVSVAPAGQASRLILALGDVAFINPGALQTTGAEVGQDPNVPLKDVSVLVLANIPFSALPGPIREGLVSYLEAGGALLITGGSQSFGSGGYGAVSSTIPFKLRFDSDWRNIPNRLPVVLRPGHPIMAGVTFISIQAVNDMNPRPDATEILQTAGGGSAGIGMYPYPAIAEVGVGAGRAVGIAFDLNDFAGMRDRTLFVQNTLTYLLTASRMGVGR